MARANHSCRPNAEFVTRKDLGVNHLRAIYTIEQGEEVEINYMLMEKEGLEGRAARQAYLKKSYDFQCICSACNHLVTLGDIGMLIDDIGSLENLEICKSFQKI